MTSHSDSTKLWVSHIRRYPLQYAFIVFFVAGGILPSLLMVMLITFALKQLQTRPTVISWPDLVGEHISRWLKPFLRGTRLDEGVSVDLQMHWFAIILIVTALIVCGFKFAQEFLSEDMGEKISRDIRNAISRKFLTSPFQRAVETDGALLATMAGDDAREIRQAFTRLWGSVISDSLSCIFFTIYLILLDTQLFILFLAILLPAGIVLRITGRALKKLSRQGIDSQSELLGSVLEKMRGWQTIQVHRAFEFEGERFNKTNSQLFHTWRRATRARAIGAPLVEWLGAIAASLVIVIALRRIAEDALSSNVLVGFLVTVAYLSNSVQSITSQLQGSKRANASLVRIHEFLDTPQKSSDFSLLPEKKHVSPPFTNLDAVKLSCCVPGTDSILVSGVSCSLKTGDLMVITGPSGTGKSTFLRTLVGLQTPASGDLKINNQKANEELWLQHSDQIAFLPQEPFVFDGTILENVIYPQHPGVMTPADIKNIEDALKCAFLPKDPDMHTAGLSGGEKQRLMFARAFYSQAGFWIMDEATSALDEETERKILQELSSKRNDRIVVAVSHRTMIKEFATQNLDLAKYAVSHPRREHS